MLNFFVRGNDGGLVEEVIKFIAIMGSVEGKTSSIVRISRTSLEEQGRILDSLS